MANPTCQLLAVTVVLGAVQLITSYSFKNCIEDPRAKGKNFTCINRGESNISAIVDDLPLSAFSIVIAINPISHIPNRAFENFLNLEHLKLDHNHISTIDEFAFRNLMKLRSLNLSCNYILELKPSLFEDLRNLTFLSLTNNRLKMLQVNIFSTVPQLDTLLLRQNFLTNFSQIAQSVSPLRYLKTLDLCFNNLTSLNNSNNLLNQSLNILYLCRNNLISLGCEHSFFRYVHLLDLSNNFRLPTKAFQGVDLSHLRYIRLSSTAVKIVDFLNTTNINVDCVDFSATGLKNESLIKDLCRALKAKVQRMTKLRLCHNGITNLTTKALYDCPKITHAVDLSHNRLKNTKCLSFLTKHNNIQNFSAEHNHFISLPSCRRKNRTDMVTFNNLENLSYRYNRILSVSCYAFSNTPNLKWLQLNINTIAFLNRKALRGLKKLETLRLDNNLLTDLFNDTFEDQINLEILNLRNNQISVIFNNTFLNLRKLTTLDLGGNKISHFEPLGLEGLHSLSKLYLDGNNLKQIDSSLYHAFQNKLRALDLQRNQIRFLNETDISPFVNLSKLSDLKLDGQRPYGLTLLPRNFFRGLRSLRSLYLTDNHISHIAPDAFDDLAGLHFLTLINCCVGVAQLQPGVFKNLKNLTKLIAENMGIQNFSKEVFGNLTQLHTLQLNRNVMQSIDVDALENLPNLHYLDIRNTPLTCTCQNTKLQNWTLHNPKVQVVYLYSQPCQNERKHKFYNFDTRICYIDLGEYLFITTAVIIALFTVSPILYVKLYWKLKYSYYVFRAWFSEQWRRLREEEEKCKYDAFISYNSSDEQWVMEQLLPNLEGSGSSFKLCLHHRDFELGRDIVDNIVSAVYSSRKTVCVVSQNFLRSEWCSLEIQLASYRLFDEHRDVLLLVFLEPVSERKISTYHRMRKVMLKKTYLQWPGSDCADPTQAQDLFWNQLRRAIRTGGQLETDEDERCINLVTEPSDTETLDETYYLLP
ncbi:toll-like receptor 21 [Sphaeramia orbicularis]|uniref:Toll-like receptor 13 n=1 Tax=Sphaeramia orbicularis TaxID=375764 RepID=A0A673CNG9_9TELE|nr:toll-like receptor 13 [Sphaeramia orbicularis]